MRSAHEKSAFLILSSRYAYLISEKAVITRKTPKPISQGYQSRSRGEAGITDPVSLMGRVTIRHNPPIQHYWHMGNNGIVILNMPQVWYGQQRYRHTADSASDLCARRHTAILVYAAAGILRQRDSTLCAYAPTSLLQTILNSNNNNNENHSYCKRFSIAITARTIIILIENESQ
jgi:hypothetical protein